MFLPFYKTAFARRCLSVCLVRAPSREKLAREARSWNFAIDSCKFPTEKIVGAQNLDFTFFSPKYCPFEEKIFLGTNL